ncbi:hypothetical protein EAD89_26985 [Micromonospora sp. BL4]|nr:hypothetical protein EAD89_26985 [Micromonospora sp. BL4]
MRRPLHEAPSLIPETVEPVLRRRFLAWSAHPAWRTRLGRIRPGVPGLAHPAGSHPAWRAWPGAPGWVASGLACLAWRARRG